VDISRFRQFARHIDAVTNETYRQAQAIDTTRMWLAAV
jgi:hypothetical protein